VVVWEKLTASGRCGWSLKISWTNARRDPFVRVRGKKERGRRGREASDEGERVAIVVPPRSEEIFVMWWTRAFRWCYRCVRSCSGC